jgi:hypothetical protein
VTARGAAAASALATALADTPAALISVRITGARTYLHPDTSAGTFGALARRYAMLATLTEAVAHRFAALAPQPSQAWFLTLARAVVVGPYVPGQPVDAAAELDRVVRAVAPPLGVSVMVSALPGRDLNAAAFSRALSHANAEQRPKHEERTAFVTAVGIPSWDMAALDAEFALRAADGPGQPEQAGLPGSHPLLLNPVSALAAGPDPVGLARLDGVGFLSHLTAGGTRSFPEVADRSAVADRWFGQRAAQIIATVNEREPGIVLLRSGTDDLIAAGRIGQLNDAEHLLRADYRQTTGGQLATGMAVLRARMTEADLSRAALRRLIDARTTTVSA